MREVLIRHKVAVIRTASFLHALPYVGAAWCLGWASTWVWGSPFPPHLGGWLCFSGVALLVLRDWWKEWQQARLTEHAARLEAARDAYELGVRLGEQRRLEDRRELTLH